MSFSDFTSPDVALKKYHLTKRNEKIIDVASISKIPINEIVWKLMEFDMEHVYANTPESSRCETLIYPILREIWQRHEQLHVWSHIGIQVKDDKDLNGVPDYLVAKESEQGLSEIAFPLLAVVEAKQENFVKGWGQCLAEMVAAQKLNVGLTYQPTVYGVVTTGKTWEIGKLEGNQVTIDPQSFAITPVDFLLGVLDFIFSECDAQIEKMKQ